MRLDGVSYRVLAAALLFAGWNGVTARAEEPRIVNIINFIRGMEPRSDVDLLEPVVRQIALVKEHQLPATFLIQYDAMQQERFTTLLTTKLPGNCEIGGWFEVVQPMVETAGLKWRGRYPWDWHTNVGFPVGYSPQEREKLVDVFMEQFKKIFGYLPKSVGSWFLDAHTLAYLADRYGVSASCNCKEQLGTDGYTLWGGYWNQAYYPSRVNALMPAQSEAAQIPLPVFRMLGSDPIYQYDMSLGEKAQAVVTLEPVYKGGGGNPEWVRWFFRMLTDTPCLAFAYTQAGQENSFGWPLMGDGLTDQIGLIDALRAQGKIRVETLADSAAWFRKAYPLTPATAVVALDDWKKEGRGTLWYDSRYYRANLFWENGQFRIRDIHRFDERYPERYLTDIVTTTWCVYDTLPILDGFQWSTPEAIAGLRPVRIAADGSRLPLIGEAPEAAEQDPQSLRVRWPLGNGEAMEITLAPETMTFSAAGEWGLELTWSPGQEVPITETPAQSIQYTHNGFSYALRVDAGNVVRENGEARILLRAEDGKLVLNLGKTE